jgi:16S rRNA (adenine(1408)-N(1))-methyltransferase
VIVDLGTGDGRGALALAASAGPGALVLGVDAVAPPMAETSRRAAKTAPNLVFLEASATAFAAALPWVADRLVVTFPWGSLLRGVLGLDPSVSAALGRIVAPGGLVSALVSVTPRDAVEGLSLLDEGAIARLVPPAGLELVEACPAARGELLATRSTWAKRLVGGPTELRRPVWRLQFRRSR